MNTRNKALIITSVILLVIALAVFLIGGWIAGWDFIEFFKSPTFVWICVIIGLYGLSVIGIIVYSKIKNL